jgi:hypothetical protein
MESSDVLIVVAEVAVAFAGFSGLLAAFTRRVGRSRTSEEFAALRTMLDYSLGTIFCCLFPFLPHTAGFSGAELWRVSSAFLVLYTIVYYVLLSRRGAEFRKAVVQLRHRRLILVLDPIAILVVALNLVGWPFEPNALAYLLALSWFLGGAALGFVLLVELAWLAPND